jgi:GDP-4-dehydro-6-deoxy-D-mannose reductase
LAARDARDTTLIVGNLSARRDFTDVRDVAAAYRLLAQGGESGEIYNVASGHEVSMEEIVQELQHLAGVSLEFVVDPTLLRPVDVPVLLGDASKLHAATGWAPSFTLTASLADILTSLEH